MNIDWRRVFENSNHWAVQVARQAIERVRKSGRDLVTVRCANTPTGVLHIGNANDVIRSYFIAKAVNVLGYESRVVFTSDDRDPIRGFPGVICDKDGNLVKFDKKEEFEEKYDGFPVFAIPDPFKCHSSWSEHFLSVYFKELSELGVTTSVRFEYYSPNVLYHSGQWLHLVKKALDNTEKINEIYKEFKEHIREYPFAVICQNCGRVGTTHVKEYDPETGRIKYVCESRHLKKKTVHGCGYEGETTIRFGKLDWYVEWAMNWAFFETDVEPMGKDHYVSSWRVSPRIAREVFGIEPPIPVPYEMFTVDGKKMSSSKGNIYNLTELLKMLEPEIVLYLYAKRPMVQRDISLKNLHLLVDEWDKLEEKVYKTIADIKDGKISIEDLKDHKIISENDYASFEDLTIYYLCMNGKVPEEKPYRLPYTFAAIVGQLSRGIKDVERILRETSHIDENNEKYLEKIYERTKKASYWARTYGPEMFRIEINENPRSIGEKEVIEEIISELEKIESWTPSEIQNKVHSIIREKSNPREFYPKIYKELLGRERGPRLGTLFAVIGREKTIELLKKLA